MDYNAPFGSTDPTAGYTDGNSSTPGSIPPAAAIELPQREIVAVIKETGATSSNANQKQLLTAIRTGGLFYFHDTGTANALAIAGVTALGAFVEGQPFMVKVANSVTGAATMNGTPIVRPGGGQLILGDLVSGQVAWMVFDGTSVQLLTSPPINSNNRQFSPYKSAQQTLATNSTFADITWTGTLPPFASAFDGASLTIGRAGTYDLSGQANILVTTSAATYINSTIQILVNGASVNDGPDQFNASSANTFNLSPRCVPRTFFLNQGDVIKARAQAGVATGSFGGVVNSGANNTFLTVAPRG